MPAQAATRAPFPFISEKERTARAGGGAREKNRKRRQASARGTRAHSLAAIVCRCLPCWPRGRWGARELGGGRRAWAGRDGRTGGDGRACGPAGKPAGKPAPRPRGPIGHSSPARRAEQPSAPRRMDGAGGAGGGQQSRRLSRRRMCGTNGTSAQRWGLSSSLVSLYATASAWRGRHWAAGIQRHLAAPRTSCPPCAADCRRGRRSLSLAAGHSRPRAEDRTPRAPALKLQRARAGRLGAGGPGWRSLRCAEKRTSRVVRRASILHGGRPGWDDQTGGCGGWAWVGGRRCGAAQLGAGEEPSEGRQVRGVGEWERGVRTCCTRSGWSDEEGCEILLSASEQRAAGRGMGWSGGRAEGKAGRRRQRRGRGRRRASLLPPVSTSWARDLMS